jgi:hypothetical protein
VAKYEAKPRPSVAVRRGCIVVNRDRLRLDVGLWLSISRALSKVPSSSIAAIEVAVTGVSNVSAVSQAIPYPKN